jgi:NAD(P)-dependent dehydrogenase (short-subunit alcohol dehydrogenase family)
MKVVVTGGTGFLGLRLARAILERGTLYGASGAPEPIDKMILFDVVTPPERPQGLHYRPLPGFMKAMRPLGCFPTPKKSDVRAGCHCCISPSDLSPLWSRTQVSRSSGC